MTTLKHGLFPGFSELIQKFIALAIAKKTTIRSIKNGPGSFQKSIGMLHVPVPNITTLGNCKCFQLPNI